MSSNTRPTKPRPPSRFVRQQLQDIEIDLGAANRKLDRLSERELEAAQAQSILGWAAAKLARVLGLGVDDSENGSNGDHS